MPPQTFLVLCTFGGYAGRLGLATHDGDRWRCRFSADRVFSDVSREHFQIIGLVDHIEKVLRLPLP